MWGPDGEEVREGQGRIHYLNGDITEGVVSPPSSEASDGAENGELPDEPANGDEPLDDAASTEEDGSESAGNPNDDETPKDADKPGKDRGRDRKDPGTDRGRGRLKAAGRFRSTGMCTG